VKLNTNSHISFSEAIQNFPRLARLVDETGAAVILKDDVPKYVLIDFEQFQRAEAAETDAVELIARRILMKHRQAFEELAK
jgi:antitoxin Phd